MLFPFAFFSLKLHFADFHVAINMSFTIPAPQGQTSEIHAETHRETQRPFFVATIHNNSLKDPHLPQRRERCLKEAETCFVYEQNNKAASKENCPFPYYRKCRE